MSFLRISSHRTYNGGGVLDCRARRRVCNRNQQHGSRSNMTKVTYEIVEHDGGWAC
jgi:hypothetical protein